MSIPTDSNFRNLSCQLGGLTLNGDTGLQTASSFNVITIDDPLAARGGLGMSPTNKFLQVSVGGIIYFLPLYQ